MFSARIVPTPGYGTKRLELEYQRTRRTKRTKRTKRARRTRRQEERGETPGSQPRRAGARSQEYAHVLDRYIARLVSRERLPEAFAVYRREIDRNPDDPGLYAAAARFLEQNDFEAEVEQVSLVLHGRGAGHGIGLCQAGAAGLAAESGAMFDDILSHYYPGTTIGIATR